MEGNYSVKRKNAEGKYETLGNIKKNRWGNYSLSIKVTPQFKDMIANVNSGNWLNLSIFEDDRNKAKPEGKPTYDNGSEVPF